MNIEYKINEPITVSQFIGILEASGLAERRPVADLDCIQGMISHASLIISAWDGRLLIGLARSITDFHYSCYLSDLAVHLDYQRIGIGKALLHMTQQQLGRKCKLTLVSAPAANAYYEYLGFTNNQRCWTLDRDQELNNK